MTAKPKLRYKERRKNDYLQWAGRTRWLLKGNGLLKESKGTPFRELQTYYEMSRSGKGGHCTAAHPQ